MQFRDRGQRDDRRRRLLGEGPEATGDSVGTLQRTAKAESAKDGPGADAKAHYAQAALPQNQRPITDLIPMRWPVIALLVLLGLLAITSVEVAQHSLPQVLAENIGQVAAGRLAAWLASTFALLAAVMAVLVYAVRRHQVDDYKGRYRIWLWAAALATFLAANAVVGFDELGRVLLMQATGWTGPANGVVWAIAPLTCVVGMMGVRLLLDMRESRLATGVLVAAGVLAMASIVMQHGGVTVAEEQIAIMIQSGLSMTGFFLLLTSMSLHGRYLLRDAQGLVPTRPAKPAKTKREKTEKKKIEKAPATEGDSSHPSDLKAEPIGQRKQSKQPAPSAAGSDGGKKTDSPAEEQPKRKLSKAERRRLRKLQRRGLNDAA